jgi:hypothetical protein
MSRGRPVRGSPGSWRMRRAGRSRLGAVSTARAGPPAVVAALAGDLGPGQVADASGALGGVGAIFAGGGHGLAPGGGVLPGITISSGGPFANSPGNHATESRGRIAALSTTWLGLDPTCRGTDGEKRADKGRGDPRQIPGKNGRDVSRFPPAEIGGQSRSVRISARTRPETPGAGTPRSRAAVGVTSTFSTASSLAPGTIPAPEATNRAFIFGSVER